jgi:NADPH2:quinone reductase
LNLGAERAIPYKEQDFVAAAKDFGAKNTNIPGVNVILDMVGGDYVARNLQALAPDGRLVNIAFLNGSKVELDLMPVMLKRLTLTGSTLRARDPALKAAVAQKLQRFIWPLLENTRILPVVHATFPLSEADQAHRLMEAGTHIGKIVLVVA